MSIVRRALDELRSESRSDKLDWTASDWTEAVARAAESIVPGRPRQVINATGVILHTNLGRAPLSDEAIAAMREAAAYSDIEYDLVEGRRASRQTHVEGLLNLLLGSQASMVVTNNAAAMLLAMSSLIRSKEVVVSRGQAIEIGDGFRLPTILRQSRVKMIEVGTTNRTTLADYTDAITERTAAFLHVHNSNFRIVGFTEHVRIRELAKEARRRKVLLLVDNGSGALVDTSTYGLPKEPMPAEALRQGADLVMFSTDKLLGGPQGGVIAGKADLLSQIRKHSLARVARPDKIVIAGLAATLGQYAAGHLDSIPVLAMMGRSVTELEARSARILQTVERSGWSVTVQEGRSEVGGGSLAEESLPTVHLLLETAHPNRLVKRMRGLRYPIAATIRDGRVVIDLRTVAPEQDYAVIEGLCELRAQDVDQSGTATGTPASE